jgi:hypothetical protein
LLSRNGQAEDKRIAARRGEEDVRGRELGDR